MKSEFEGTSRRDFIKVTTFGPASVYEAAVDEARRIGIRVVGHADSRFVGVERAWKARQSGAGSLASAWRDFRIG